MIKSRVTYAHNEECRERIREFVEMTLKGLTIMGACRTELLKLSEYEEGPQLASDDETAKKMTGSRRHWIRSPGEKEEQVHADAQRHHKKKEIVEKHDQERLTPCDFLRTFSSGSGPGRLGRDPLRVERQVGRGGPR